MMFDPGLFPKDILAAVLSQKDPEQAVYLVGGAVRDAVLGCTSHDLDFACDQGARQLARRTAKALNGAFYMLDEMRETARVVLGEGDKRYILDFAIFRGRDLAEDLRGRDFTLNAMAVGLDDPAQLIDPLGGAGDLQEHHLRLCSPTSLEDDPLRALRAVRMATQFDLKIGDPLAKAIRSTAGALSHVSMERQRDELFRSFELPRAADAIRLLDELDLLPLLLPELSALKGITQSTAHRLDAWEHSLAALRWAQALIELFAGDTQETPEDSPLRDVVKGLGGFRPAFREHFAASFVPGRPRAVLFAFAALYHDAAKPNTRVLDNEGKVHFYTHEQAGAEMVAARARELMLSNAETAYLHMLVKEHLRVSLLSQAQAVSRRAIFRFFRDTSDVGVDLCVLSMADILAKYDADLPVGEWRHRIDICNQLLSAWYDRDNPVVHPPRLVSGEELMAHFHREAGKWVGDLLAALEEEQAQGTVKDKEQAFYFASTWLKQYGKIDSKE
ncbi:MAG TPA: HD domain-containing protein [Longilinea sp.]|nr:HD domain-containing protein [Longilinea sp.]